MKRIPLILLLFISVFYSCEKKINYVDTLPQLEIIAKSESGSPVSGASVQLFLTQEDWDKDLNIVANSISDANGSVIFTELEERVYYFYVEKGGLDNVQSVSYFENPLKINEIKVIETTIK